MSILQEKRVGQFYRFVQKWDGLCYICGRPFANMACVTRDHIIPISLGGRRGTKFSSKRFKTGKIDHIAPAHHACNHLRGNKSLLQAAQKIDQLEARLDKKSFHQWLNKSEPNYKQIHWTGLASMFELGWIFPDAPSPAKRT